MIPTAHLESLLLENPEAARRYAAQASRLLARLAREDVNAFVEYVMRDEQTGRKIVQAPVHREVQKLAGEHRRLLLWAHTEFGKTSQLAVARPLWELGRNPNLRFAIISRTVEQAMKPIATIKRYIESSAELRDVFPALRPGTSKWGEKALTVHRSVVSRDPSLQATGVGTSSILGSRLDGLILDDVLTFENTRTADQRQQLWDWYHSTLSGRLTADARVWVLGTAFHPEDFLHRLSALEGWTWRRFPVIDEAGKLTWLERWPQSRIEQARAERGPHEFARQMLCQARDDSQARFKREWINQCIVRGAGKQMAFALRSIPQGYRCYTGVDLGVRTREDSDLTVFFTIIVHPDESREVLNIESGRWAAKEITDRVVDIHRRFGSIIMVESNQAQDYIRQFVGSRSAVPVRAFTTGRNKVSPEFGIESLATEMSQGKWIIPSRGGRCAPEIEAWVSELLYYDPRAHTGDRLMASWIAKEGARKSLVRAQTGRVDTLSR